MEFPATDWAVFLVFFLALILVAKFREQIRTVDRRAYRDVALGSIILTLTGLGRIYNGLGFFEAVPFLSEATFYDLVHWIAVISGLACLISGVSVWLPLAQTSRRLNEIRLRRLELLRTTEQLVSVESRLERILTLTVRHIADAYQCAGVAAFRCSRTRGRIYPTASQFESGIDVEALSGITFNEALWQGLNDTDDIGKHVVDGFPDDVGQPRMILPIIVDRLPAALILVWTGAEEALEKEDYQTLRIVSDTIARKIKTDRLRLKSAFLSQVDGLRRQLAEAVDARQDLKQNLRSFCATLAKEIPFDMLSLAVFDPLNRRMSRFTVTTTGGGVLEERALPLAGKDSLAGYVLHASVPLRVADMSISSRQWSEAVPNARLHSWLAVPVNEGATCAAALIVAAEAKAAFTPRQQEVLLRSGEVVLRMVHAEHIRQGQHRALGRQKKINRFIEDMRQAKILKVAFEQAAQLLSDEAEALLVRISMVEPDGAFLHSRAMATRRPLTGIVPADGTMVLSLMGRHREAIESAHQVLVDQRGAGPKMSAAEATQSLTEELQSALLTPVKVGGKVVAIISLAEMRGAERFAFDESVREMTQTVAGVLALTIRRLWLERHRPSEQPVGDKGRPAIVPPPIRNRLKSPLTSLMGSVEVLRTLSGADEATVERHLGIIDRSAQRIQQCVAEETVTVE